MKKKDTITVLEITEKYLKIAQSAGSKGRRVLTVLKAEALPQGIDDQGISHRISGLFKRKDIKKTPEVILCLSRYLVTARYLKIPSREPAEIEKIIALQASKYLPYPSEELIPRYYLIGQDPEGHSRILLVIVHQDVINRHLRILKESNLSASMALVSSYGLYNWYLSSRSPEEIAEPVMLVDINPTYQDLAVICAGKLVFTRSFSVEADPQDPASVNLGQGKITEEINRSMVTYRKDKIDKDPAKIILTGNPKSIGMLGKRVSIALSLPVATVGSLEKVALKDKVHWEETDFSFSSIIGLALGSPLESLDLIPKGAKEKKKAQTRGKAWLKVTVLFVGILFTLLLGATKSLYDKNEYLQELKVELNKLHLEAGSLEEIKNRLEIIREQVSIPASSIDALYELYRITSPGIILNSFSFDEKKQVLIKGQAQDLSAVFKLVSALEKSEYFRGVAVKNASKRKTRLTEVADFEIVCPLLKRR